MENPAVVLKKQGKIDIEDWIISEPKAGEVQLRMQYVGICGSDVRFWQQGRIGDCLVRAPMVLGHEGSGVVSKLGECVTHLKIGDRVAIEPGVPCGDCQYCTSGRYNLCPDMRFCAIPPDHGNLARFYNHAANFCFKLPDNVSTEEGALLQPLSCAVHECRRAGVTLGSRVLVCGAGPIGLLNLMTAKASGASKICITDIDEKRLELAKKVGADYTVLVKSKDALEVAKQIEEAMGLKPEIAIECSGVATSIKSAVHATASGGRVVLVGLGPADATLPVVEITVREIDIRGCVNNAKCFPTAIEMVASGRVNVMPLITHRFKLQDSVKAFETAAGLEGVKIMIDCTE